MTNRLLLLVHRIVLIIVCLCISPSFHYGQTKESQSSSRTVVKYRSSIDLNGAQTWEFNPIDKLLALWRKDGTVQIVDITNGRERAALLLPNKKPVAMHWAPGGLQLLINNSEFTRIWDARFAEKGTSLAGLQQKDYLRAEDVKWSPNGTSILTKNTDSSFKASLFDKEKTIFRLWSAGSGRLEFEVKVKGIYGEAKFSSNGKLLLTSSFHEDAKLWDVETGRLLATFTPPDRSLREGSSAAFSPDGKSVVVHSFESGIYLWDCVSGLLRTTVALERFGDDEYSLLGFSPNSKVFAIYREHLKGFKTITSIELRDGETGELRATLTGKNMMYAANQVVWSGDGQTLITGGGRKYDGKIWDVATGRLKATFPMVLTYDRIPFSFGSKNRDNLSVHPMLPIVSAVNEEFVRLWSLETGELLQRFEKTKGAEWTTDGKLLLTSPTDLNVVQVWELGL